MSVRAMPEWLTRRDDTPQAWDVSVGAAARGQAWTNRMERKMHVPDGNDPLARVIRAHEMMHAKVSPLLLDPTPFQLTDELIRSAEEYRVNLLIGEAGFDVDALTDGSEKQAGKYLAENGKWNDLVIAMAACAGTKSASELLAGVKSISHDLHAALREVEKIIVDHWHSFVGRKRGATPQQRKDAAARIGSTMTVDTQAGPLPEGYVKFTIELAKKLEALLLHPDMEEGGDDEVGQADQSPDAEQIKKVRTGKDEILKFWPGKVGHLPLTRRVKGNLGKRRTAAPMGRNPRRIHRLLVDPQRRIFDSVTKGNGGIVVIDTSGSMNLTENDLQNLLEAAPGCVVISYGVRQDGGDNMWILADRGKVCDELPDQRGLTNGSDGPALHLAASKRRGTEPFIWVTDGGIHNGKYLTDVEKCSVNLMEECVGMIVKHGIHQVGSVADAVTALKNPAGLKMKISSHRFTRYMR